MRGMRADKSMSETCIWTYDCFNAALKGAGQRAGYQDNLSAYCFRRAFAHAVEGG
jgi:site-specific recombinase XerD